MKINNVELTNDDYEFVKRWSELAKIVDYTEYMDLLFDESWCNAHYRQILTKVFNSPFHDPEYNALRNLDLDETSTDIISPDKCIGEHEVSHGNESSSDAIKPYYYKNYDNDLFLRFKNGLLTKEEYVGALSDNKDEQATATAKLESDATMNDIKPDYYKNEGHDLFWHFKNGLLTKAEYVGALKFNIIKYTTRYAGKNGLQDLQKANEYLNELTEFEYGDNKNDKLDVK